jgi:protein-S-isoprenylcysteine O-methyltransferase Ste14
MLGLILFSFYNKLVEEKELLLRFGKQYEEYKRKTPFLIPKLWR